jgi:uncharacterized protein (DUF433 family)
MTNVFERIEINPRVCNGKPVIKGTRIPVSIILEQIAEDVTWDALLKGYPELTRDDIHAALVYARESLDHAEVRFAHG